MEIDGKSTLAVEEGKVITDISVGTSERVVTPGPRIRRKQARTIEEQIAAEKEKLDNCGF